MGTFQQRIREVRLGQEARARSRRRLTDAELGLDDGCERFAEVRDELGRFIEARMAEFQELVPGFAVERGFFDGRYFVTLARRDLLVAGGRPAWRLSRISFLVAYDARSSRLELEAKLTAHHRDLATHRATSGLSRWAERDGLPAFVERELLRLAQAWLGGAVVSPQVN